MVNSIERIGSALPVEGKKIPTRQQGGKGDFRKILDSGLTLSKHVTDRIGRRQLDLGAEKMKAIESAVDKAAAKGAKDSLVLLDDLAVLVSVKNRTVITAMDRDNMKEGVFTQIDSAIIV